MFITNPSRAHRIEQVDWFSDYRDRAYGAPIYMQRNATIVEPRACDNILQGGREFILPQDIRFHLYLDIMNSLLAGQPAHYVFANILR